MQTLRVRLAALVLFALLCVLCTYWFMALTRPAAPAEALAPPLAPPSLASAEQLFGGSGQQAGAQQLHVVGILSFGRGKGAAAIIASADGTTHTLAAGQSFDRETRVAEVRAQSVILEHGHERTELFLGKPAQSNGYLR